MGSIYILNFTITDLIFYIPISLEEIRSKGPHLAEPMCEVRPADCWPGGQDEKLQKVQYT